MLVGLQQPPRRTIDAADLADGMHLSGTDRTVMTTRLVDGLVHAYCETRGGVQRIHRWPPETPVVVDVAGVVADALGL